MSEIKECFVSRFPEGVIMESDFSQLEVVGLAALSLDPVLIEDLLAGRDMHTFYTAARLNIPESEVTPKERRFTKQMTFQLQYGSGAKGMAHKLGLKKNDCQVFIDTYYARYQRVKEWQEENIAAVQRSRKPSTKLTASGQPAGRGELHSPSGRIYRFYEMDPPESFRDTTPNFLPTQIKNYPVQGFATGDIMALFRQKWLRWWVEEEEKHLFLPINTVHDSGMNDCASMYYAGYVANALDLIVEDLPQEIEDTWGIKMPVPLKIEHKAGPTWASMEKM